MSCPIFFQMISSALDGKIILWEIDTSGQELVPVKVFVLTAEHLPRNLKVKARGKAEVGITSLAVNHEDRDIIMIGINIKNRGDQRLTI